MIDSGASTLFINQRFIKKHNVTTRKLRNPIPVYNIDGTPNQAGQITHVAVLGMRIGEHEERAVFTVTDIGPEDVIIGIDWLRKHNPSIDWYEGLVTMDGCPKECQAKAKPVSSKVTPRGDTEVRLTASRGRPKKRQAQTRATVANVSIEVDEEKSEPTPFELEEGDRLFAMSSYSTDLATCGSRPAGGRLQFLSF